MKPVKYKPPKSTPHIDTLTPVPDHELELYESNDAFYWRSIAPKTPYQHLSSALMPKLNQLVYAEDRIDKKPVQGDYFHAGPTLSPAAQADLNQEIDVAAIPWVKYSGEAELLYLPKCLERFIRPVHEIISFYRSTLPTQELWKYIRVRGSITSRYVENKKQQRGVGVWHIEDKRVIKDNVPNFTQSWIGVSNVLPTVTATHVSKELPEDAGRWEYYNRRYVQGIERAQPYQMNVMSGYTWHMGDFAPERVYRTYLHIIFDIERHVLKRIMTQFDTLGLYQLRLISGN